MPRLLRPRTAHQRAAATTLVNVVFVALITWLLAGTLPTATDRIFTSSVSSQVLGR